MTTPDDHLSPQQHTRQALHRAIDRVCDSWPHALCDAEARGYTSAGYGNTRGTAELTSVEAAASRPCRAVAWIAELGDILIALDLIQGEQSLQRMTATAVRQKLHYRADKVHWQHPAITRIIGLANKAALWWPTQPPTRGTRVGTVTVGERGNQVEQCGLCGDTVAGGHGDPIRRIDGQAFHGKSCWFTVMRSRRVA
jgi:hypothetical protein